MLSFQGERYLASTLGNIRLSSTALYIPLIVLCLYLIFQLIFGDGGYSERKNLKSLISEQKTEVTNFSKRNRDIYYRIQVLKSDSRAVEGQARNELGLIKPGETFYQVVTGVFER